MIPFADCINHHNVDSTYELLHTKYHRYHQAEDGHSLKGPKSYYSQSKMEGDYSDLLKEFEEVEESEGERRPLLPRTQN